MHGVCTGELIQEPVNSIMAVTAQDWLRVSHRPDEASGLFGRATKTSVADYADSTVPDALFSQSRPVLHRRRPTTPGSISSSRSTEDILERNTLALNPVTGPGATTFSSVASAFDFQHHLGSDPAIELLVLKRILLRECLLSRLEAGCCQLRKQCRRPLASDSATDPLGGGAEGVVELLSRMRDATVGVIEAVAVWREDMDGRPPSAFVWHGENYLLKITSDLNFLAGVEPLVAALKVLM